MQKWNLKITFQYDSPRRDMETNGTIKGMHMYAPRLRG